MPAAAPVFQPALFDFLLELELNNNRAWFEEQRERYEADVREPSFELIRALRPLLEAISPAITARDSKVGGSLMRIHRDIRFSADKTPYKTNVGIQFRHRAAKDVHAPGYYLHLSPDHCFFGAGSWMPDRAALTAYREAVAEHSGEWTALQEMFERTPWRLEGERLKRPPRGWSSDHPMIEELKRKHFIAVRDFEPSVALRSDFPVQLADWCQAAAPLIAFLCTAAGLEF